MFRLIAVLAISLLVLIGCGDVEAATPPSPPQPPVQSGSALQPSKPPISPPKIKKAWDVQISSVEHPGKSLEWSPYGRTEEASGEWLVVDISLKNIGTSNNSINRNAFRIKDAAGKVYNHYSDLTVAEVYGLYRDGDLIDNKVISPGTSVRSYLVFDVPSNATGLQLEFTPNSFTKSETFVLRNSGTPIQPAV